MEDLVSGQSVVDIGFAVASPRADAITSEPGDVGPITIVSLIHDPLVAAHPRRHFPEPRLSWPRIGRTDRADVFDKNASGGDGRADLARSTR